MRNVQRVHLTDIWSWYRVDLRVGDHLGRSEELVSRCVECDLAEPESLASLGGSAPGVVDGILSTSSKVILPKLKYPIRSWIFLGHITFQIGIQSLTTRIRTLLNGGTGLSNPGPTQS